MSQSDGNSWRRDSCSPDTAEDTMLANRFTETDAILATATDQPSFSFRVPNAVIQGKAIDLEIIRRDRIGPAV